MAESLENQLATLKGDITVKRDEFYQWLKDSGLKRNQDYSDHEKHGKKFKKLKSQINEMVEKRDALEAEIKAAKPKKASPIVAKYEYPADVITPEQKKQYRVTARKEAKKAEKLANSATAEPKAKKVKAKEEEVAAPVKKKKKVVAAEEDED